MEFQNIEYQWFLIIIPIIIIVFRLLYTKRRRDLTKLSGEIEINRLININPFSRLVKFIFLLLMIIFSIFAIMRPKWGSKGVSIIKKGFEIVFMLDVSPSMLAIDVKPNRLIQAKTVISTMVDELIGNKFALILFSGEPTVDPPLTEDVNSFKEFYLKVADVEQIPLKGTIYGKAMNLAEELFSKRIDIGKAIIIVSDGESHDSEASKIAEKLYKEKGILTCTIGIGTEEGSYIPEQGGGKKMTADGNIIKTRLVIENLKKIAEKGGGKLVIWGSSEENLKTIYNKLDELKKGKLGTRNMQILKEQYQYFILVVVIIFILYLLFPERKINFKFKNFIYFN